MFAMKQSISGGAPELGAFSAHTTLAEPSVCALFVTLQELPHPPQATQQQKARAAPQQEQQPVPASSRQV